MESGSSAELRPSESAADGTAVPSEEHDWSEDQAANSSDVSDDDADSAPAELLPPTSARLGTSAGTAVHDAFNASPAAESSSSDEADQSEAAAATDTSAASPTSLGSGDDFGSHETHGSDGGPGADEPGSSGELEPEPEPEPVPEPVPGGLSEPPAESDLAAAAEEPAIGTSDPIPGGFDMPGGPDPGDAMMIEEASPAPARAEAARDTSPITVRWSEVKALFVDDPADSVRQASGLVDESVARLVTAVRDRQASLAAFWQDSTNAGTEELRKTLQNYLRFSEDLEQMSAKATTSSRPEITGRPGAVTAS